MGQLEFRVYVAENLMNSSKLLVKSQHSATDTATHKLQVTMATNNLKEVQTLNSRRSAAIANEAKSKLNKVKKEAVVVSNAFRTDRVDHVVVKNDKRSRCRLCKSQTVFKCTKCEVGLHPKCFEEYHISK